VRLDSSIYAFVSDFVDAGVENVADDLAARGFSSVSLATVYHAARDLLPHNPKRAVAHRTEGVHYFPPSAALYTGPLQPAAVESGTDDFGRVISALAERSLGWQAWTVYLHNCRLAIAHPECAVVNAFGDTYITDLCPSSDAVAAYAVELTTDVARLRPSLVVAESLHHAGFGHGYHHERAFVGISPVVSFLLSLCFCDSCRRRAAAADVDAAALAARVRDVVRGALSGSASMPDLVGIESVAQLCGGSLVDYVRVREDAVTTLAGRCADAARANDVQFGFMDQTGGLKGYATGTPTGAVCATDAWQLGVAPAAVAAKVDAYVVLGYAQQPARVGDDVAAYRASVGKDVSLRCVLRHGGPDYLGAGNVADKVRTAADHGADGIDFYHYGLMPIEGLDAASAAIRGVSGLAAPPRPAGGD
jgi:hypothetical protein